MLAIPRACLFTSSPRALPSLQVKQSALSAIFHPLLHVEWMYFVTNNYGWKLGSTCFCS